MARGKAVAIELTATERDELAALRRRHGTTQAAALEPGSCCWRRKGCPTPRSLSRWRSPSTPPASGARRFAKHGSTGCHDEPRPGAPRQIGDDAIAETIRRTLETRPAGATYWSLRSMAKVAGYAPSTIHRIWQAFGLQPHLQETFKLSSDPLFVEKALGDIVVASAGRKRPRGRRNVSGASRQSQRPKPRLKQPSVTMTPRS